MNLPVEKYEHHGKIVAVQSHLKGKHREHCLCWQGCKKFKPENREENCERANELYDFCVKNDSVTPVWECPEYDTD